jgi:hypothetical protein
MDDVDGFRTFEIAPKAEDVLMPERNNETIAKTDIIE